MPVRMVWAQARGGVIGAGGTMPWHLPEDLKHFARTTKGSPVVMGRRTWQSFPPAYRPLPGRTNIVITRDDAFAADGALRARDLPDALDLARGVLAARSVDIGCVRMTERHLHDDPPTEDQVWAALSDIVRAVEDVAQTVDLSSVGTLVGLAGSVTTVTAHALGLPAYQSERIHGAELEVSAVVDACTDLLLSPRSRRREMPFMHEGRVDVIGAGALIWRTVVQRVAHDSGLRTVRASETDILDGIALSQLRST